MKFTIRKRPSPNFWGRRGHKPKAIVNHITAGNLAGSLAWLCNPKSGASSNFVIGRDGSIWGLVDSSQAAWANGNVRKPTWGGLLHGVNPNLYTISIEHEGFSGVPLTEIQYQATLWLHRVLLAKWGIPVNRGHIIGHCEIDSVVKANCPGKAFPFDRLVSDLQKGV